MAFLYLHLRRPFNRWPVLYRVLPSFQSRVKGRQQQHSENDWEKRRESAIGHIQQPTAFGLLTPTLSPARFSTPTRKFAITSAAIDERPLAKKQTQPEPSHGPTHSPVLANWTAASSAFLDCSLTQSRIGVVVLIGSRRRRLCGAPTRTQDAKRLPFTAELQPQQTPSGDVTNGSGNSPVA